MNPVGAASPPWSVWARPNAAMAPYAWTGGLAAADRPVETVALHVRPATP